MKGKKHRTAQQQLKAHLKRMDKKARKQRATLERLTQDVTNVTQETPSIEGRNVTGG